MSLHDRVLLESNQRVDIGFDGLRPLIAAEVISDSITDYKYGGNGEQRVLVIQDTDGLYRVLVGSIPKPSKWHTWGGGGSTPGKIVKSRVAAMRSAAEQRKYIGNGKAEWKTVKGKLQRPLKWSYRAHPDDPPEWHK